MLGIYKFNCSFRGGDLFGIFEADDKEIELLLSLNKQIYFGEVLGKHSEVIVTLDNDDITLVTKDPEAVCNFVEYNMEGGINPFDYYIDVEGEEEIERMTVWEYINKITNNESPK